MENPSVIVGMACRVPGASTPNKLWDNIIQKKDLWQEMPKDRFNIDAFYHPESSHNGTINTKGGYFLDQPLGHFDNEFFGISGKEAVAMDPQQRILLEVVYEALEDAGIPLESVRGSSTAVYCGTFANANDYNSLCSKDLEHYPTYSITGTGNPIISNRISYFYGFQGPSMTIDTACSSALVGLHLGSQSLQNGEAAMSVVVGSALQFAPNVYQTLSDIGFLSPDSRCRSFDADCSGYVRGDGICAIVLKPENNALHCGDRIRAIVRGTATNHDGKTDGITLPSSEAQEALIRSVYSKAGLNPDHTQFFETHGTGTKAGDPGETRAIGSVFATKSRETPLYIGSASGLAGLIKTVLAMENSTIPPNMLFKKPNPDILFKGWKIEVPTIEIPWNKKNDIPRRASISSFGYGGSNAHAILEAYDKPAKQSSPKPPQELAWKNNRPYLVPISSHTEDAGKLAVEALKGYLHQKTDLEAESLAYSLGSKRSMHMWRSFTIGHDRASILHDLQNQRATATWNAASKGVRRVGFVFTGQGAQYYNMGRQLIQKSPLFRDVLDKCDKVLQSLPDGPSWSIIKELLRDEGTSNLGKSRFSQPICTAIQLALVCLLRQWAVVPTAVCGHSSGEIAAAYAAGILSVDAAIVVAYYRGLHMNAGARQPGIGAMIAVGMDRDEAAAELRNFQGRLTLAAINSPSSVTISGDKDAICDFHASLKQHGVFARLLKVEQAFHSHHMLPLAAEYKQSLENCPSFTTQKATCRMFSSVTARDSEAQPMDASYWVHNMIRPVKFADSLIGITLNEDEEQNVDILLEIGPHPALKGPSREVLSALKVKIPYIGTLNRDIPAHESLLEAAGQLFTSGYSINLDAVNRHHRIIEDSIVQGPHAQRLYDLPPYSWNHKNYWFATRLVDEYLHRPWRHMLLGAPVPGSTKNMPRFRNYIRLSEIPWLKDHVIDSKVLFPAAGFICMAVEAGARLHSDRRIKKIKLRDLLITSAMTPKEDNDEGCEVLTELYPVTLSSRTRSDDSYEFSISSYDETNEYKNHCRGRISLEYGTPEPLTPNPNYPEPAELYATSDRRTNPSKLYASLSELNMHYGPRFALLKDEIHTGPGFAISQIQFDPSYLTNHELSERTIMHPTFLDASMHAMFPVIEGLLGRQMTTGYVDTSIGSIDISGVFASKAGSSAPQQYTISTFTKLPSPRVAISDILIYQPDGQPMIELHGIEATEVQTDSPRSKDRTLFFRQRWQPCFEFHERNDREELPRLLRTYSFQYPTSKVLCITSQAEHVKDLIPHIWFSGTQRPRFGKLHIWTNNGADDFDSIFDGYPRDLITVCEPEDGYHLIIDLSSSINLSQDDLEALLCPGGFLICTHASKCDAYDRWNSCHVSRRQLPVMNAINLAILMPSSDSVSPRTKGIIQQIRDSQATSTVTVVDPILLPREELPASTIVVLASLDEDIKISDERWIGIRDLLNREDITVIWLLQGATNECSSPDQAAILGMLRAIRSENQQSRFITLDVEVSSSEKHISKRILQVSDPNNTEEEFADRSGCLYIPRVEEDVKLNRKLPNGIGNEPKIQRFGDYRALTLKIGHVGVLESLHFVENDELANNPRKEDEVDVKVMASAINFHDIAVAMGIIQDHTMNGEFAGIVLSVGDKIHISELQPGDRVVGFSPGRCAHGSLVRTKGTFCYKIPDSVGFTIAASLPVILSTAMYCLVEIAHLQPGETVLIHAAAGGVGQMAVQIAQNIGARVLATCSEQKRDFLRQYGLLDSQIFSSRDESFVQGVFRETDGQGVDVVLNSLAGALLQASWGCIKTFGRFVEIGKRDIHQNSHLGMYNFRKNATFTAFDMVTVFEERPKAGHKMLSDGLGLFLRGEVSPPKALHVFPYSQVEKAFRTLQLGKQPGKVIIVPDENDNVLVKPSTYCQTKPLFSPFKVYLLVGGLGGLGIILSEWMHLRGARRFAFLSRSGDKEPDAKDAVKWLREKNSEITVFNGDVGLLSDVESVVTAIGASLAGIFHLAVNFEDSMVRTLSLKQLRHALHAKCEGAMNLHVATKSAKLELDFFVCVSSGASVWGNRGQASYSAANAWLDAFSRWRREQGLPATTMNPGAITTRGQVVKSEIARQSLERNKLDRITEQELTYQAEEAVTLGFPKGDPKGLDWHQLIIGINVADPDVYWSTRSLFRGLYANRKYGDSSAGKGPKNLAKLLQSASTAEERITIAVKAFVAKVASVLGTQLESITSSNALSFYGLDSIVAVEFRRWFKNVCHVDVSLFDVLAPQSIHDLVAKVVTAMPKATVSQSNAVHADDIANRSKEIMSTQYPATFRLPKSQNTSAPLSAFQAPLASMLEKNGDNALSNLVASFRLRGSVSFEMLETSLRMVVDRHSSLKTAFCHIDRSFYQEILPTGGFLVRNYDISSNNYSTSEINNFIFEKASEPLHIANGELGLALLVKLQDNTHLLAIIVHPICFDRASLSVFLDDWTKLYDTIISGGDPTSVAYPRVTYVDFTVAQKEHLHSSESLCHLHYWSSSLKNLPKPSRLLQFAHESQPVSMLNRKGSEHKLRFNAKLLSRLRRITSLLNATPFHFLVAAFRAYMYWQTSDSDIAILKVVDDRPHPSTEHMVGNFMNFIPIRLQVDDDMVFEDLVLHARDITRQGEIHSDVPFDGIVTALGLESTDNCMPVSQLGIRYRANTAASVYSTCDFVATAEKPMNMPSIFDLSLDVEESENDLALSFGYSKELYRADHMELFSHTFHGFLSSLIRDHRQPVKTTSAPN
ncbi:hypothetical protein BDV59DRAFT_201321 [Aspergillus ambiguus]|uniref:uncharacterized protein n=1 Tax=Aspergillus ambiguus TaxID=176160 RepID=UPI003CCDC0A9